MAAHLARGARVPDALGGDIMPARAAPHPAPGIHASGALVGIAFGQLRSATLKFLGGLRSKPAPDALAHDPARGLARDACRMTASSPAPTIRCCASPPAPARPLRRQAHAETRALAAALAPHLPAGRAASRLRLRQGLRPSGPGRRHAGRHSRWLRSRPQWHDARCARAARLDPRRHPRRSRAPYWRRTDAAYLRNRWRGDLRQVLRDHPGRG